MLYWEKGPLNGCCCCPCVCWSGPGESSPAMNFVRRPPTQLPIPSRLGFATLEAIHEPDLSSCGAATSLSLRPFNCSRNVTLIYGEFLLRLFEIASQYLSRREYERDTNVGHTYLFAI